jgi:pimeloyl-ACP methyl ester carboxylesterase
MKAIILSILLLSAWTHSLAAPKNSFRGFVSVAEDRELFVDWFQRSENSETIVLLNGLTYDTTDWEALAQQLAALGKNVLRYDAWGQGESLKRSGELTSAVTIQQQVEDLRSVLEELGVERSVVLVGLSYGGAVGLAFQAKYPDLVMINIPVAPFLGPLAAQDLSIRNQVAAVRAQGALNPLNSLSDDEMYDYFLKIQILTTYPQAEPSILRFPGKIDGVFRLVQGVRRWRVESVLAALGSRPIHLVTADLDQYVPKLDFVNFWNRLPPQSRKSYLNVLFSEHKVPERYPFFLSRWIQKIVNRQKLAWSGKAYAGNPLSGLVSDGFSVTSIYF